ncbi:hypothetical protein RBB50_011738 [Rhinocladiella similis]
MGLKEGTLESLIESEGCQHVAETVFHQVLQALDCLALHHILHRDVKPANILYVTGPNNEHRFQLGDFGLSNRVIDANTLVGSPLYMAPEMFLIGEETYKVDIWSLFVTMLRTLDVWGFRRNLSALKSPGEAHEKILSIASKEDAVSKIREMATLNPVKRASAAQMLVKCFDGAGLSTPRSQVPTLNTIPASPAAKTLPGGGVPIWTTTIAQQKPKGSQKNGNPDLATGQYRVEKTRHPMQGQLPKQTIHPSAKKRLAHTIAPPPVKDLQIPGSFPGVENKGTKKRS